MPQPNEERASSPVTTTDRRDKMSVRDAAELCCVDYDTFLTWVRKGVLPHVLVGPSKTIRVYRRDVEKLIQPGS